MYVCEFVQLIQELYSTVTTVQIINYCMLAMLAKLLVDLPVINS